MGKAARRNRRQLRLQGRAFRRLPLGRQASQRPAALLGLGNQAGLLPFPLQPLPPLPRSDLQGIPPLLLLGRQSRRRQSPQLVVEFGQVALE